MSEENVNEQETSSPNIVAAQFPGQCQFLRIRCHICGRYYGYGQELKQCHQCHTYRTQCSGKAVAGSSFCSLHVKGESFSLSHILTSQLGVELWERNAKAPIDPVQVQQFANVHFLQGAQKTKPGVDSLDLVEKLQNITIKNQKILKDQIIHVKWDISHVRSLSDMLSRLFTSIKTTMNTHIADEAIKKRILDDVQDDMRISVSEFALLMQDDVGVTDDPDFTV